MDVENGERFRNLRAWQKAHELVIELYALPRRLPAQERFILIPQFLRAAVSVAANLAEDTKRRSIADQKHFFNMAETSLEEVKYYLFLMLDLHYLTEDEYGKLLAIARDSGRLINGLIHR